jgi:hypothetical protein
MTVTCETDDGQITLTNDNGEIVLTAPGGQCRLTEDEAVELATAIQEAASSPGGFIRVSISGNPPRFQISRDWLV